MQAYNDPHNLHLGPVHTTKIILGHCAWAYYDPPPLAWPCTTKIIMGQWVLAYNDPPPEARSCTTKIILGQCVWAYNDPTTSILALCGHIMTPTTSNLALYIVQLKIYWESVCLGLNDKNFIGTVCVFWDSRLVWAYNDPTTSSLALYDLFSILANILVFSGPNISEAYRHQVVSLKRECHEICAPVFFLSINFLSENIRRIESLQKGWVWNVEK